MFWPDISSRNVDLLLSAMIHDQRQLSILLPVFHAPSQSFHVSVGTFQLPSKSTVLLPLRDFGLFLLFFFQSSRSSVAPCVHLDPMVQISFGSPGFRNLNSHTLLSPEDNGSLPRVPFDLTVEIYFGTPALWASGVSILNLKLSKHYYILKNLRRPLATKVLFRRNMQEKKFIFSKSTPYSSQSRCLQFD
jgi:hypothetical protein